MRLEESSFSLALPRRKPKVVFFFPVKTFLFVRFVRANTFLARVLFLLYVQLYTCCVPTTSRYGLFVRLVRARKVFVRTKPCFVRTIQQFIRAPANQNQGSFSTCPCKRMFVCTITLSCTCKACGNAKLYVRTRTNFSREYCLCVTIFTMSGSQ